MTISITGPGLRFIFAGIEVPLTYVWVNAAGDVLPGDPGLVGLPFTQNAAQQTIRLSNPTDTPVTVVGILAAGAAPYASVSLASPVDVPANGDADAVLDFLFDGTQVEDDVVDVTIVGATGT